MNHDNFTLDMTMMFAVHDALRRDAGRIARITATKDDDPCHLLRTAVGWEMFKAFLRVHLTAEDDSVWAVLGKTLADRPDDLELLAAMEAEHAAIDPLLAGVDDALADRDGGPGRLGDVVDALTHELTRHLKHEEDEALRLIDAMMTPEQWKAFSDDHKSRIGPDAIRYLPWLLDDASPETAKAILGRMPEPLQFAYENEWRTAYLDLHPWGSLQTPAS